MRPSRPWCAASCRVVQLLAGLATLLLGTAGAESWRQVIDLNGRRGAAIGAGAGNTLYAGLTAGHVLRSEDNGLTWTVVTNGLVDAAGGMLVPKAFVVSPTGRIIRGGDNASWNNKAGSPVFVSDNAGARWNEAPLPFASPTRNPGGIGISDLVVHQGALFFSDLLSEGVWKSADNGSTWTAVGESLPTAPFVGFAKTYYALASAGEALLTVEATRGVFRSTDGGAHWAPAVNGIPGNLESPLFGGRTWNGIDVVGRPDGTAFAVVDGQVYRSRDAGSSWTQVGAGIIVGPNPYVPSVIQPTARKVEVLDDRVFVSTTDGNPRFFEGTELGESWTELPRLATGGETASILAQSFYAHNGALYFAASNGIHRLDLGTASRTHLPPLVTTSPSGPFGVNAGGTLQVTAVARGTAPFTYEWRLNDLALPGQTSAQLNFTASAGHSGGPLTIVVRNSAGSVTNLAGTLSIAPRTPGAVDYGFRPVVSANTFAAANVTAFAFGPDGSVFLGGALASTTEAYTGVRKVFLDGTVDRTFITGSITGGGTGPGASAGPVTTLFPLGDGSVLVGASATSDNARYYRRLLPDGSLDSAWPWPAQIAGGPRKFLRLADGRLLVAGGSTGGIHRLNADGTYDSTWQGPASIGRFQQNYVNDFAVLPDGRILIAGKFNDVDGTPRVGLARLLPEGALDRTWVPAALPFGAEVYALAVLPNGKLLIGGAFLTVGGQPHRNLAQLNPDGSLEPSLADLLPSTSPAGLVNAFAVQPDGRVWVGGSFAAVAGRAYLFRLNTNNTVDTDFPDVGFVRDNQGGVTSLAYSPDGRLWIGSGNTEVGGNAAGQLFRIFTDAEGPTQGFAGPDRTPTLGETLTLTGSVNGAFTGVQWRFNGTPIPGATHLSLTLPNLTTAQSGHYELLVTSTGGSSVSAPLTLRVRGSVVFDTEPQAVIGIVSNAVALNASAFGQLPIQYQWFREGVALGGATNRSLSLTNLQLTHAGEYSVRATGGDGSIATSAGALVTVIPAPGTRRADFRLGLFPTSTFTVFQDLEFLEDGRVIVAGNFATSAGGPNAFIARLHPDGAVDSTFQFDPAGIGEFLAMDRQADGKLVVLVRGNGYLVRRLLENGARDDGFADLPVDAALDVKVAPDGGILVSGSRGLARLHPDGSPDNAFAARLTFSGSPAAFDVDSTGRIYLAGGFTGAGGVPLSRLLRLQPDGTLDGGFAPTNTLGYGNLIALADGALYNDGSSFYRFDDRGRQDLNYGWSTRLQVWDLDASGGLAGVLPSMNGDAVLRRADGGAASPVAAIKVPISFSGYSFLRVAPDGTLWLALGGNGSRVDPATMLYPLNGSVTPLALIRGPQSLTVNVGAPVQLSATATGTSHLDYQWRRDGTPLTGETNATLVIPAAQPIHNGDYTVVVRNRSGAVTSQPATLLVLGLPEILSLSGGGEFGEGDPLRLAASVRGVAPLSFEWRLQGVAIPEAHSSSYTNPAVHLADAGEYTLVVANPLGTVTSRVARVTVVRRPGAVIGSFTGVSAGSGMELNLLPSGDFLVDDKAYDRFGNLLFRLPFPDGTSTVLRDRIAVDAANGRIYAGPTQRVRAYTLAGSLIPDYAGPNANVRLIRIEAAGTVLQSTEGLNPPLQRLDRQGALATGFNAAAFPTLDALPLPDGRTLVLGFYQRTVGGRILYNSTLSRLLPDGAQDEGFARSTNVFPGSGQATRLTLDQVGRILVLGGTGVTNTARLVRLLPNGTADDSFHPAEINGPVTALAEQTNGRLVIVGEFTRVAGQSRNLIARLNPDGSLDTGFDPGTGLTRGVGQNTAFDVLILPTGEIVVTGTFEQANGMPRRGIAMFSGDATAPHTPGQDAFATWIAAAGFTGDQAAPGADPDGDGRSNAVEFAHGTSPGVADPLTPFECLMLPANGGYHAAIAFQRRQDLSGLSLEVEIASTLDFTDATPAEIISTTPLGNGFERVVMRSPEPVGPRPTAFFRITLRK